MRLTIVFLIFLTSHLAPSSFAEPEDYLPLFQSETVLKITIEAPFATLIKTAPKATNPYEGQLLLHNGGEVISFDIKLNARGISRRDKIVCRFPPLMINFKKGQVKATLFKGQNKIKLVTHCQKSSRFEQLYFLEYANYRVYNVLTPLSLKVRMAEITYIDTEGKNKPVIKYGFFIEDIDNLAKRNNLEELEVEELKSSDIQSYQGALYAMFQYFIGNLDWSNIQGPEEEGCCHNSKLLIQSGRPVEQSAVFPVPYDFDFSGMVNAPYALPPEGLKVSNVRKRLYRGACLYNGDLPEVVALFNEQRAELEKVYEEGLLLDDKSKKKALNYINSFFDVINDPSKLEKKIINACLGKKN